MALGTKKDKLIEEAQKFIIKGQLDKAITSYQQVVALEPSAISLKQKLADLLVKAGRLDEAKVQLESIGKYYAGNGFYLKAIAVYKQLQKLFVSDVPITLTLAGLNEKHGLIANALTEYKHVYDFYEKSGNAVEALKTLDKMQTVDPQNINIKIKLAEAYHQNGRHDDSYALFAKTASLLQERSDNATLAKLTARIQQLFPEKSEFMLEVLEEQVRGGNPANAINGLQAMLRANPHDRRVWKLIIEAYRRLKQDGRVKVALQHFFKFFPDDTSAMEGIIECQVLERDVKGTLELLHKFEQPLVDAGGFEMLDRTYKTLDEIDPINAQILNGWIRICVAFGKKQEATALQSKLDALINISSKNSQSELQPLPETSFFDFEESSVDFTRHDISYATESVFDDEVTTVCPEVGNTSFTASTADAALHSPSDEDIEIEVDIDDEFGPDFVGDATVESLAGSNWLDSVGELFDSIATSPRGIKFGSEMDASDAQSHYDLGVAFKEMGLFDEAINEFREAAKDTARRVDCLILQGACLRERGELSTAENFLGSLMKPGLEPKDSCAVKYELALTFEALGKVDAAAILLEEIAAVNPGFKDVRSRLDAATEDTGLDFSDDELQGFDLQ